MTRPPLSLLTAAALSMSVLGGCFELTSSSTEDDPAPYNPQPGDGPAGHWSDVGDTSNPLIVLGHQFQTATIGNGFPDQGTLCTIYATVEFVAPYDEYMRFQAKITMSNGAWIKSPIFYNDAAGSRKYAFDFDTSGDGCWGAQRHYTANLHVAACRGANCDPGLE